jgi:enamine deaminase RidA (YjgF/YER057c/UK114 family)
MKHVPAGLERARVRILRVVKHARNPGSIHPPLAGYSHHIELEQSERLLVISGQVGMTQDGQVPDDPGEQFDLALANVLRNVEAAGTSAQDIVKLTFYLTEPIDQARRAAILGQQLGDHAPCMTLLFVAGLATPRLKVEIDAWASSADNTATA